MDHFLKYCNGEDIHDWFTIGVFCCGGFLILSGPAAKNLWYVMESLDRDEDEYSIRFEGIMFKIWCPQDLESDLFIGHWQTWKTL